MGRPEPLRAQRLDELERAPAPVLRQYLPARDPARQSKRLASSISYPLSFYGGTRALLLAIAGGCALVQHKSLGSVLSLFDGSWYLRLAEHGYPSHALHVQSTLGFFPLYPLAIRAVSFLTPASLLVSALAISLVGGGVAAVLVQRLATHWWGESAGRRAVAVFCLFPGSIVFSLAYSECLTIPLALGCLLALRRRSWWLAGALAGLATAVAPVALVLVAVCALASLAELRATGLGDREGRRSLAAPALSVTGVGAFAVFLWIWTGTPFASLAAQHYGWYQQAQPLGIFGLPIVRHLVSHPHELVSYLPSWNLWNGIAGTAFLLFSLVALSRSRAELSRGALAFPIGVALVTVWSVMTPPNARMILIAVPAVIVWARRVGPRWRLSFFVGEGLVFVFMSALTLSGHMLP